MKFLNFKVIDSIVLVKQMVFSRMWYLLMLITELGKKKKARLLAESGSAKVPTCM